MIDHTGVGVSDFERSKAFHAAALARSATRSNIESACHDPA